MSETTTSTRKVQIVPPVHHDNLQLTEPHTKAAGLKAVQVSLEHLREEVGMVDGIKLLNKMNQKDGFDCSGCAWPDPDGKRSKLGEYCENGVKALAEEATKKRLDPSFFAQFSVEELSQQTDFWIGKAGRITEPMILHAGKSHYEPISWDDAFAHIGQALKALDSPHKAVFYTSGRTSNEAAFMYQLLVRTFGTNNLPDCSNMCHESSGSALSQTVGIGKGSVTLDDIHEAEVILVIGQNPGTNHPRMLSALTECKKNGGRIVSINPLPEAGNKAFTNPQSPFEVMKGGTQLEDYLLQVKVNGDVALLKSLMKLLYDREQLKPGTVFDQAFIKEQTLDFDAFLQDLATVDAEQAAQEAGVSFGLVKQVAELLIKKKKIIACWAMGLTQHKNGVQNIREVVNLLLMRGAIGKPGAGTCPVRGHSNVQGDRTMGIWEKPPISFLENLDKRFGIEAPRAHGYDVVDAIKAMDEGKVEVFIGMGGNFISATPDSEFTGKAMQKCKLSVQVSTKLNRSHLVSGETAIILPCIARSEKDHQQSGDQIVSMENSMGIVHSSKGIGTPASNHLKSEHAIVAGIAKATGLNTIDWDAMIANYDVVRDHIEAVIPGFDDYNERVRRPEGFYLPNGAREGKFNTASGKAHFTLNPIPVHDLAPDELVMMTVRSHDQYNTTIYGLNDRYRGIFSERRIVMTHPDDIAAAGLKNFDLVDLTSTYNGVVRTAESFYVVPYDIAKGCVATYFPEANCLVPIHEVAEVSNTPASKFVKIRLVKR